MLTLAALSLAIWIYLLTGHGFFWQSGPSLPPTKPRQTPRVTIVVPARDEAPTITRALRSLLAQDYAGAFRVILVDDRSSDGTGEAARNIADPRLTVIEGAERPVGWSGKLWALAQGVDHAATAAASPGAGAALTLGTAPDEDVQSGARTKAAFADGSAAAAQSPQTLSPQTLSPEQGAANAATAHDPTTDLIFLTDADIEHAPEHLSTLVAKLTGDRLDMVSEMVSLNCDSLAEQALVPAFVYFFAMLYPFARVNDPGDPTAAAAGGTVLIRAESLRRIGGIAAMRGALIDDVTLAGLVKRQGRIWLGHSQLAASIRPYPEPADIWRMIARTAYVQLRYNPLILAVTVAGMAVVFLLPPVAALCGSGAARSAGVLAWLALCVSFLPTLQRFRLSMAWAPFLPVAALFYTAATVGSAADHMRGRGVQWKRRSYG